MKRQVVVIHGGDTFKTRNEYVAALKEADLSVGEILAKKWKALLGDKLGRGFEVIAPRMPNSLDARYAEWRIWFEKLILQLDKEVVLVGHSLGGIFLAKHLSQNDFPRKIRGLFLVSPPHTIQLKGETLNDFELPKDRKRLAKYAPITTIYFSKDDDVVPFGNLAQYEKDMPGVSVRVFKNRGHFTGKDFSEIVRDIKAIYKK